MAGFFGLFNYEKEGPGIAKNAPKKKTFIVFFETFFRNFWKLVTINLIYSIISVFGITNGLANAGITNVARNLARDKHSFGLSDFFDTLKKNWKQALPAGIINLLVYIILLFDFYFFSSFDKSANTSAVIGIGISLCILLIFTFMNYFIWTLMITFKFSLKQIYSNSFRFALINLKGNLICFFSLLATYALFIAVLFLLQKFWVLVLLVELLIFVLFFHGFKFLLIQYCIFPSVKKYIIDPYYKEHPEDDIEKRRDLGLEIEEDEKPEEPKYDENGELIEVDSENVFTD